MRTQAAIATARTREWPSFHGSSVPLPSDPFTTGQEFIRALHHRLCQPLTALGCTLEMMQMGREADSRLMEQLQVAMTQTERMAEMMGMFRQLLEAETLTPGLHMACVGDVLGEVISDLSLLAEMQDVQVELKHGPASQGEHIASVCIPRNQLRQAIWNVVQNAIELAPAGSSIRVTLSDRGMGLCDASHVTAEELSDSFDPFSYTQNRSRATRISNLPLAVAKRMVVAAGGEITLGLIEGMGRRFDVRLPMAVAAEAS